MDTTSTPEAAKKAQPTYWTAFLNVKGIPKVLSAKYQKDLKKLLNNETEAEVLSIVRGKSFSTKIVTSFDIVQSGEYNPAV